MKYEVIIYRSQDWETDIDGRGSFSRQFKNEKLATWWGKLQLMFLSILDPDYSYEGVLYVIGKDGDYEFVGEL